MDATQQADTRDEVRTGLRALERQETCVRSGDGVDEDGFATWMTAAQPRLTRTAYLLTGEHHTAQDLVAESLAKVLLAWGRIDPDRRDAYARRTLVTTHTSWWRRAWRRREVSTDAPPDCGGGAEPAPTDDEMWRRLATLPPRQRAVLVLRYYEQLSQAEIAEVLGISVGTVKSQSSRALAKLRIELEEES